MAGHIQIKTIRELKNFSQAYVARKMGISQPYYSKLENGHAVMTHELMNNALKALDVVNPHPIFLEDNNVIDSIQLQFSKFQKLYELVDSHEKRLKAIEMSISELEIKNGRKRQKGINYSKK